MKNIFHRFYSKGIYDAPLVWSCTSSIDIGFRWTCVQKNNDDLHILANIANSFPILFKDAYKRWLMVIVIISHFPKLHNVPLLYNKLCHSEELWTVSKVSMEERCSDDVLNRGHWKGQEVKIWLWCEVFVLGVVGYVHSISLTTEGNIVVTWLCKIALCALKLHNIPLTQRNSKVFNLPWVVCSGTFWLL